MHLWRDSLIAQPYVTIDCVIFVPTSPLCVDIALGSQDPNSFQPLISKMAESEPIGKGSISDMSPADQMIKSGLTWFNL